jgi:hypothetical protein
MKNRRGNRYTSYKIGKRKRNGCYEVYSKIKYKRKVKQHKIKAKKERQLGQNSNILETE